MGSTTIHTNLLFLALSDISHPLEGTFYLFLLAVIFRWRWPNIWNKFLKKISANEANNANENDINESKIPAFKVDDSK